MNEIGEGRISYMEHIKLPSTTCSIMDDLMHHINLLSQMPNVFVKKGSYTGYGKVFG